MKLSKAHREEVVQKLGANWTQERIRKHLASSYAITVTQQAIAAVAKTARLERTEATKAIVREKIGSEVATDLDTFGVRLKRLVQFIRSQEEHVKKFPSECDSYLKALDRYARLFEAKLHYSGANEAEEALGGIGDLLGRAHEKSDPED